MLQNIIQDIQERLKTISSIRYIDENRGQLSYDNPPVQFPCALIDVDGFQYTQKGELYQQGEGTVYVTLADIKIEKASEKAFEKQKQKQIARIFFELITEVHSAIHETAPQDCTPFIRTSLKKVRRSNNIREFNFVFNVTYMEKPPQDNLSDASNEQTSIQ